MMGIYCIEDAKSRLDSRGIRDSINFYQSGKRGRKRVIEAGDE